MFNKTIRKIILVISFRTLIFFCWRIFLRFSHLFLQRSSNLSNYINRQYVEFITNRKFAITNILMRLHASRCFTLPLTFTNKHVVILNLSCSTSSIFIILYMRSIIVYFYSIKIEKNRNKTEHQMCYLLYRIEFK